MGEQNGAGEEVSDDLQARGFTATDDKIMLQRPRVGSLRTCSYNVRGCNELDKRNQIDAALHARGIHIACLQETKLTGSPFDTDDYAWTLCYDEKLTKTNRGTDIKLYKVSGNIFHCSFEWMNQTVNILNVYMPSSSTSDFIDLGAYALKLNLNNVLVLEDFNAHIGRNDRTESDSMLVGNNLYHDKCNENGEDLKKILHATRYKLKSSFEKSGSLLITWHSGMRQSQIDHVLLSPMTAFDCCYMSGSWTELRTDHKLIICDICVSPTPSIAASSVAAKPEDHKIIGICKATCPVAVNPKWNVDNLSDVKSRIAFQRDLMVGMEGYRKEKGKLKSVDEKWARLTSSLKFSASRTLNKAKPPLTPRRKSALDDHQRSKFLYLRDLRISIPAVLRLDQY